MFCEVIDIYDRFENLNEVKKQAIMNAGFKIFGEYGYSKASIDDIVREAGISKGSLFYYFGSKKNFFLYLYEYAAALMKQTVNGPGEDLRTDIMKKTDFFDRLDEIKKRKMKLSSLYPHMSGFIKKAPFETSGDVYKDIQMINQRLASEQTDNFFENLDLYKFKEGIDPYMVFQLLSWCAEGIVNHYQREAPADGDDVQKEIDYDPVLSLYVRYSAMLRKCFYKEEYLDKNIDE